MSTPTPDPVVRLSLSRLPPTIRTVNCGWLPAPCSTVGVERSGTDWSGKECAELRHGDRDARGGQRGGFACDLSGRGRPAGAKGCGKTLIEDPDAVGVESSGASTRGG